MVRIDVRIFRWISFLFRLQVLCAPLMCYSADRPFFVFFCFCRWFAVCLGSNCHYLQSCCHGPWNTSCRYTKVLRRRQCAAFAHPSVSQHYFLAGHLETYRQYFSLLSPSVLRTDPIVTLCAWVHSLHALGCTSWPDWFFTARPGALIQSARRVFVFSFSLVFCCLHTVLFRSTCSSSAPCYAQLQLSLLCPRVALAKEGST